jgi:RNA polymerase sigma-70 factor (ECF subfamily)
MDMPDWSRDASANAAAIRLGIDQMEGGCLSAKEAVEVHVERLFGELREKIYAYLGALGASAADAEDITQESFIRLYLELRAHVEIANASSWLFRAASNLLIDETRSWRSQATVAETEVRHWIATVPDPQIDLEASALRAERVKRLNNAMLLLTSLQLEYLHLRAEGLRYREIAEIYGVAVPTVQDVVRRAVERLGKELQ